MQFEGCDGFDLDSGCNPWMESCDVYGGAAMLLMRRLFPVCGPRLCRPRLELQLLDGALDGVFRHERCGEDSVRLADFRFVNYDGVDLNWGRNS